MKVSNKNYFLEKSQDIIWHVTDFVRASIYSPIRCIKRVVGIPSQMIQLFNPIYWVSLGAMDRKIPAREMTHLSIQNGFYDSTKLPQGVENISKEKLHRILNRTAELAKQMGITQGIRLYSAEMDRSDATVGSAKISSTPIPIFITPRTLNCTDEQIDFIIAHEISHAFHNDMLDEAVVSFSIFAIEMLACFLISPFAVILIEGAASVYENYRQRTKELAADRKAITILGSSEGLIQFCNHASDLNLKVRQKTEEIFKHDKNKYFASSFLYLRMLRRCFSLFSKEVMVCNVSPEGNNRFDLRHPSLEERKKLSSIII